MTKTSCGLVFLIFITLPNILLAETSRFVCQTNYKANLSVSANVGYMNIDIPADDNGSTSGIQVAVDCPLAQQCKGLCKVIPAGTGLYMRYLFNYNHYSNGDLKVSDFEVNFPFFYDLSPNLSVGLGPGIGHLLAASETGKDANLWTFQVGTTLEYHWKKKFNIFQKPFVALNMRYQFTENQRVGMRNHGLDNSLVLLQLGVGFPD